MTTRLKNILTLLVLTAACDGGYNALKPHEVRAADAPKPHEVKVAPQSPKPVESEPFITDEQMAAKNAATTQCLMEQNVPLMGFGLKVVCVKKEAVLWVK